jgi:integrase
MQSEIAYGLQQRADERRTRSGPDHLARLLTRLPSGVESLRERSPELWMETLGWQDRSKRSVAMRFLVDTLGWLDDLDGVGWDAEYHREAWRLRRLGYPNRDAEIRFDGIAEGWLRELVKRWARWRLSTGIVPETVSMGVRTMTLMSQAFPQLRRGPGSLTRSLLECHLANLATRYPNAKGRTSHISAISSLLITARQHGWEPGLLPTAAIYREDYPRIPEPMPRGLSEAVMAQLEAPSNLERFPTEYGRMLVEILMNTGLRVGDACRLSIDCLVEDPHGAPYVRYRNHKMRRDAMVPITDGLAASISAHQRGVIERFPEAMHLLPRPLRNPDGMIAYSTDTFRVHLHRWLVSCNVRDELGRPVHVTPHQWRHTYATRLINSDVSQEAVRRLLDHSTHHMTARYARLSDQTIRAKWEAARKVDVHGAEVRPPKGELADAEWMKNNLARAKMALPNGYCALPLQQRCEFANACLTCPMFVTTAEFLPQHHQQLSTTRKLIARAEADGQMRMVEMNRSVEANLVAIVHALDPDGCGHQGCSSCAGDSEHQTSQPSAS